MPSLSPNYAILEYQIDNKWVRIARQGGVRNARDDAGTSISIPDRDMLTGSYITSLTHAQSPKFGNEGGLATSQNSCFWEGLAKYGQSQPKYGSVPIKYVSMSNADSGCVGVSINMADSKKHTLILVTLKMKQQAQR